MVVRAVVFDLDGTIVNSPELQRQAYNSVLERYSINLSEDDWRDTHNGLTSVQIWEKVRDSYKLGEGLDITSLNQERREIYKQMVREGHLTEIGGFSSFYTWLQDLVDDKVPILIATNGHPESVEASLGSLGLLGEIKYYSIHHLNSGDKKELYIHMGKELGVSPLNFLVFEDSPSGSRVAKSVGAQHVVINSNSLDPEVFSSASLVVDDYKEPHLRVLVRDLLQKD